MRITGKLLGIITIAIFAAGCSDQVTDVANPSYDQSALEKVTEYHPASPIEVAPASSTPGMAKKSYERSAFYKSGGKLVVDDDGVECSNADYNTIQAAVNDAATMPGIDKIEVCAGTYPEDVTIGMNNPMDIRGAGVGQTVVTGAPGSVKPIIHANLAGLVDLRELTVDGMSARSSEIAYGIRYDDTAGKIMRVEVLNIRNATGSTQGIGIGVRNASDVSVEKSHIENYTRVGVFVNGEFTHGVVRQNTIIGPVEPTVWAPNGIQISRDALATVMHNEVDNNPSPNPPGGTGSGIIFFCAGPTKVTHNNITRADVGISIADNQRARVNHNEITDSGFDGISLQFLGLVFGDIGCGATGTPTENNQVNHNTIRTSTENGVSLANFDPTGLTGTLNDNEISHNDIFESGVYGLGVFEGSNNEFKENDVTDSGEDGIRVETGSRDNFFKINTVTDSGTHSCHDETAGTGTGTATTANTWENNTGEQPSMPPGIC